MARIQLKRGLKANLPSSGMLAGEAHFTTDRGTLHVATDATTKLPIVPAIDDQYRQSSHWPIPDIKKVIWLKIYYF